MKLRIARSALTDLQDIRSYYIEQRVPDAGVEFVSAILSRAEILIDDAGRKVPEFNQENIRELIHPPFRVVYLRDGASITVVRVWRSERSLQHP